MADKPLLDVRQLSVLLSTPDGSFRPVDEVSFEVCPGETLALVGESGSGKTMTALAIMRLLPAKIARIEQGQVLLKQRNLVGLSERDMLGIRGRDVGMIFQEPLSALNPVYTAGEQVAESLRRHERLTKSQAWKRAVELFTTVGIPAAEQRAREYPHQLSGGMRQRVMIATAIACNPSLLIADEPTTALDVSVQAQILDLLQQLQRERTMGILLITHDLGIVAEIAQRVAVMYAGQIVEMCETRALFEMPLHPYTRALLNSVPKLTGDSTRLEAIEGAVPDLCNVPGGCRFQSRCAFAVEASEQRQELREVSSGHFVRCVRAEEFLNGSDQ